MAIPDWYAVLVRAVTAMVTQGDLHAESQYYPLVTMYGRKYFGNERTTFVIDSEGKVAEVLRKVKPAEHDERVLAVLAEA